MGSLIFWAGFTLSEPAWSAPAVEAGVISVSKIAQRESGLSKAAFIKDSDTKLQSDYKLQSKILPNTFRLTSPSTSLLQEGTVYKQVTYFAQSAPRPNLQPLPCEGRGANFKAPLRHGEGFGERSADLCVQHGSLQEGSPAPPFPAREGESLEGLALRYPNTIEILPTFRAEGEGHQGKHGVFFSSTIPVLDLGRQGKKFSANVSPENFSCPSPVAPALNPLPTSIEHQTQTHDRQSPCNPVASRAATDVENSPTPSSEPSPIRQLASGEDPELGNLRLRQLEGSPTPSSEPSPIQQSGNGEDPELGNLRLRELEGRPTPSKPAVYLLGGVGYLRSSNVFSGIDPVDDGLLRAGLTLLANPSLGPQTSLFASVGGNVIRYGNQSQFDYNELRFNLGIRQQLSSRAYGEAGWGNRQLFDKDSGDRFLNEHSLYLELGRRDALAKHLTLDTYYQFRLSFADPTNRSQAINSVGASLAYYPSPSLQLALDYQFALANFTQQERQDQYHQLIARLTYTISPNSRLYLFGGRSFGNSSDPNIDLNGFIFGAGVDFNFSLF